VGRGNRQLRCTLFRLVHPGLGRERGLRHAPGTRRCGTDPRLHYGQRPRHGRDQYGATRRATLTCDTNARTSVWRPAHQHPPGAWPSPRPSPTAGTGAAGGRLAAATPASRSFVLASLRALHLDPRAPDACSFSPRRRTPLVRRALQAMPQRSADALDKPFHISAVRTHAPLARTRKTASEGDVTCLVDERHCGLAAVPPTRPPGAHHPDGTLAVGDSPRRTGPEPQPVSPPAEPAFRPVTPLQGRRFCADPTSSCASTTPCVSYGSPL